MATSSITKNFVVEGKDQVERFADAVEKSANSPVWKSSVRVTELHGDEGIKIIRELRNKVSARA